MAKINEAERITQKRVIALFRDKAALDYEYYGDLRDQVCAALLIHISKQRTVA